MNKRTIAAALFAACLLTAAAGCDSKTDNAGTTPPAYDTQTAGPLPDKGYKAEITLPDPPTMLRAGQKQTINVKVKNTSEVTWLVPIGVEGNKYVVAVMNSWLDRDGKLLTDMDGRHGIQHVLAPGDETELPLLITAPKEPGDYILELDMVQEQVSPFKDKGSPTLKVNIKVE